MSTNEHFSAYSIKYVGMNQEFDQETNSLLHNPEFQDWVISPTPELDRYWQKYITENPQRRKELEEAVRMIKNLIPKEKELTKESAAHLWSRIEANTYGRKKRIFRMAGWMTAASFLLALGISGVMYFLVEKKVPVAFDYQSIAKAESSGNDVKLIFSDQTEEILKSTDVEIKYESSGDIIVNADRRLTKKIAENNTAKERLNQLVVPFGKRTNLTLADGTKLYLNSGSRAIFPVVFTKKQREIFIEGEAYLEVAHDPSKPFKVVTDKLQIEVLGTKFNVSAYPEDLSASVVLVEGGIQATVDSKTMVIKPNQRFVYEKNSHAASLDDTDVLPYISWKDGWMYCEKESLESIATKLSRYYNVKIQFKDEESKKMSLTGKLDLKNECVEIFHAISSTAPITCEMQEDTIVITQQR